MSTQESSYTFAVLAALDGRRRGDFAALVRAFGGASSSPDVEGGRPAAAASITPNAPACRLCTYSRPPSR